MSKEEAEYWFFFKEAITYKSEVDIMTRTYRTTAKCRTRDNRLLIASSVSTENFMEDSSMETLQMERYIKDNLIRAMLEKVRKLVK